MLQRDETEKEILLGNKQLAGIFLVMAIFLAGAFTAGYMLGRGPSGRKPTPVAETRTASLGATMSVPPESGSSTPPITPDASAPPPNTVEKPSNTVPPVAARHSGFEKAPPSGASASPIPDNFLPQHGQTFLQVAAVSRDEAEAVAEVLAKKGFRAHAVPKPGDPKLYRVLIGPIRDAGDYSSTRDSLRKTGFNDVIAQRY